MSRAQDTKPRGASKPGRRGWPGRGGGQATYIEAPDEWRGSTSQVCGLWPFAAGTGSPMIGVPLGRNLLSGATLCCDPLSWFERGRYIRNPSAFVLGLPGLGKSTLVRRWLMGLSGYGVLPLVLGDLKPDYVDVIEALGGQVIRLAPGRDHLNVLDASDATDAAARLTGARKREVIADARSRRQAMISALITITQQAPPTPREEIILERAIRVLDERHLDGDPPVLADLLRVIQEAPAEVRQVAIDRGDEKRYQDITENLEAVLMGLAHGGRLGQLFSKQTTTRMKLDRPVVFDVSAIGDDERDLQAAVLMACWSYGFGMVNVANALADAGIGPQRHYFVVMDELWRALRSGSGMVDRADALTRLNRSYGVGQVFITHTMSDLLAVPSASDREKAKGFVERAGMLVCGGLPGAEMAALNGVAPFSASEQQMIIGWQDPPAWNSDAGGHAAPPGQGNFLVKVGGRPGIPINVGLTQAELSLNDTNKRWQELTHTKRATPAPSLEKPASTEGQTA